MAADRGAVAALAASFGAIVGALLVGGPDWLSVSLFGALILCLASLTSTGSRLLSGALWVYLGEVSFAVYMVCIPWQLVFTRVVEKVAPTGHASLAWGTWLLMLAGVVPVAMLAHHLVERPARDIMRKHGVPFRRARRPLAARVAHVAAARR